MTYSPKYFRFDQLLVTLLCLALLIMMSLYIATAHFGYFVNHESMFNILDLVGNFRLLNLVHIRFVYWNIEGAYHSALESVLTLDDVYFALFL